MKWSMIYKAMCFYSIYEFDNEQWIWMIFMDGQWNDNENDEWWLGWNAGEMSWRMTQWDDNNEMETNKWMKWETNETKWEWEA